MINRISEIPFWGPEEQIRKFVNRHDEQIPEGSTQQTLTQQRIENIDEIFQKQLIWSYGISGVDDAYFYWDWCPIGAGSEQDPKWQLVRWEDYSYNQTRDLNRTFKFEDFKGYTNENYLTGDDMPKDYDSRNDKHAKRESTEDTDTDLSIATLRHNIMRSYLEVSEWLGDGAIQYGSQNGYVSRKMSLCWLFDAIRALINWKLANQDKWAEVDIHPLVMDSGSIHERFLGEGEESSQGHEYDDESSLDQSGGCCMVQQRQRAKEPWKNGVFKVRGNEYHYGERAWFYTHNSFVGECRFFHNARFLGQTTFDKEINGTAMRSRWADLAEFKESDEEYLPGTLVMFGGEKEVTLSRKGVANAIVTTKPGFILNGDEPSKNCIMAGIALTGTVPVRIVGTVKKFDRLVPSKRFPGLARRRRFYDIFKKTIGIAMQDGKDGTVECVTRMAL